jgi:two-component system phosphate regulon response regulator PhoB
MALRNIVFRFDGGAALARALDVGDHELPLPESETVADGEWVIAVFEVDERGGATATAARGVRREAEAVLTFELRDWERLRTFAEADSLRNGGPLDSSERQTLPGQPPAAPRQAQDADPAASRTPDSNGRPGRAPSFDHWRASDPFTQGPNARVLVVDDDRDIRDVVGAMLDAVGLTVDSVPSAEEALERMRAQSFDLVVLDWNLPGITGVELCRLLRRDPALTTMPVLFLTAHASSRDVVEAFASGADDYVVKPFRAPELGARIFGLLRRARMSQAAT